MYWLTADLEIWNTMSLFSIWCQSVFVLHSEKHLLHFLFFCSEHCLSLKAWQFGCFKDLPRDLLWFRWMNADSQLPFSYSLVCSQGLHPFPVTAAVHLPGGAGSWIAHLWKPVLESILNALWENSRRQETAAVFLTASGVCRCSRHFSGAALCRPEIWGRVVCWDHILSLSCPVLVSTAEVSEQQVSQLGSL